MLINEFLPNPVGKDTDGEWIELFNDGQSEINLTGWQLKDASGKAFIFKNQKLGPADYLLLDYKTTKISLNNSDETLFLCDNKGILIDKLGFTGAALEGKSVIRQNNQFVFSDEPSPAKANVFEAAAAPEQTPQDQFANLNSRDISSFNFGHLAIGIILALAFSALFMIFFKKLDA